MLLPITERMFKWPEHQVGTEKSGCLGPKGTFMSTGTPFAAEKLVSMNNSGSEKWCLSPPCTAALPPQLYAAGMMLWRATKHFIKARDCHLVKAVYGLPLPHCCQVVIANQENMDLQTWLCFIDGTLPFLKSHNPSVSTNLCCLPSVFSFLTSCKC